MELLPGIHQLKQDMYPVLNTTTAVNVVFGEKIAVIDTGVPWTPRELLFPYLRRMGRNPEDIALIVNTHGHGDHVAGNREIRDISGAQIMIHELDAPMLRAGGRFGDEEYGASPADVLLHEGDVIDLGGFRFEVVHLPGHSAGSIGLYEPKRRVLFCGDALQAYGTNVQYIAFYQDADAYLGTLEKVSELQIDYLIPEHPYAPFTDSFVAGDDVRRYLDVSRDFATRVEQQIARAIRMTGASATVPDIARRVCAEYGYQGHTGMAVRTISTHLTRMERLGQVRKHDGADEPRWSLID